MDKDEIILLSLYHRRTWQSQLKLPFICPGDPMSERLACALLFKYDYRWCRWRKAQSTYIDDQNLVIFSIRKIVYAEAFLTLYYF